MFMYNGYSSYDSEIQRHIICNSSLSTNIPSSVAEEIALPYLKHINELISTNRILSIVNDKDFKWALEIFSFGFTCEGNTILQLCSNIYIEWLKVFESTSNNLNSIPLILREKTEFYWSLMFWHLYHLFVNHDEKLSDLSRKRMYTHNVLRHIQAMINQADLSVNLWHIVLQVFLAIGDTVLSQPYRTNEECTSILSYRLVPSIYQVFLAASGKVNIPPGLWKTFRDYAVTWRHRPAVIYDWAQLTCVLTSTVVRKFLWSDIPQIQYICTETDQGAYTQKVIDSLSLEVLLTTWIKFLTILQNPSDCGDVSIFLQMPKYASLLQGQPNIKLREITSLQELPRIFVNVTKAIGLFVSIWLGYDVDLACLYSPKISTNMANFMNDNPMRTSSTALTSSRPFNQSVRPAVSVAQQPQPSTSTLKPTKSHAESRRVSTKSTVSSPPLPTFTVVPPITTPTSLSFLISQSNNHEQSLKFLRTNRPTVNSLMHLYGPWILDACLLQLKERHTRSTTVINANDSPRMNDIDKRLDNQSERFVDEGLAKSFATLCMIFCSVHCNEYIHAEYLSRFYYVLQQGLRSYPGDELRSQAIIESILLNSANLFRINLSGVNILLPLYFDAMEYYLHNDVQSYIDRLPGLKNVDNLKIISDHFIRIRGNCIQILMSIVSLPFHYENLRQHLFEDYFEKSDDIQTTTKTFLQYRYKIFNLLQHALKTEHDSNNIQLLFGTLRLACSLATHYDRHKPKTPGERTNNEIDVEDVARAVLLICDRATKDSHVFLAGLDTLISFLTDPICYIPIEIWKTVLKKLCAYIDTQLRLEPRSHTREMHSTCVATYNTLITLIIERPTLLDDVENLFELCEIIELGISGSKAHSAGRTVYKKDKEYRPASQRVAEAAEYLMFVLFEHKTLYQVVNVSKRSVTGACRHGQLAGGILNDEAVLHLKNDICRHGLDEATFSPSVAPTKFKYFALNGNTLFGITELPNNKNNDMPALILLCRGLFGKHVWTSNFRQHPQTSSSTKSDQARERLYSETDKISVASSSSSSNDSKEKSIFSHVTRNERIKSCFPPPELSIPTLGSIVKRDEDKLNLFRTIKTKQMKLEDNALQRSLLSYEKRPIPKCKPPASENRFESIRLFLSHYGFCSLDAMYRLLKGKDWDESKPINHVQPSIQMLDSSSFTFIDDIRKLDKISPTLYCTAQIFYLKHNQHIINESFSNTATPEQMNPSFLTMISNLGSVVEVKRHCGWTGNIETSWKTVTVAQSNKSRPSKTLADIDGENSILYWVDLTTEMAFYLPHQFPKDNHTAEMRILIIWLEDFRDDLDSVLPDYLSKNRDISIIGIYPLDNRLFRIVMNSNIQRMQSACASIPLVDGMVLPLSVLPFFLRQAVNNLGRRQRLEDSQHSHTAYALRKKRITNIIDKYRNPKTDNLDEFLQNIFFSSTALKPRSPLITRTKLRSNSMIAVQS